MKTINKNGYISVAYLSLFVMVSAFFMSVISVQMSSYEVMSAFDVMRERSYEKKVIGQIVEESVLGLVESKPGISASTLEQELTSRIAGVADVGRNGGITWTPDSNWGNGANYNPSSVPFTSMTISFPTALPADLPNLVSYTNTDLDTLSGRYGWSVLGQMRIGRVAPLGRLNIGFRKDVAGTVFDWDFSTSTELIAIPLTNYDFVVYGLPASGSSFVPGSTGYPLKAPALAAGFNFSTNGVKPFVMTANRFEVVDGSGVVTQPGDPTLIDNLVYVSPNQITNTERLPYQTYRDKASLGWNFFEYLVGDRSVGSYQESLLTAAVSRASVMDFGLESDGVTSVAGITLAGNTATLDLNTVVDDLIVITDGAGGSEVRIQGNALSSASPLLVVIRNFSGFPVLSANRTRVVFEDDNARPVLFYMIGCGVSFANATQQVAGGMVLCPNSSATFSSNGQNWFGHFSYYYDSTPVWASNGPNIYGSDTVKNALATVAPKFILASVGVRD